jgi:hypothetical protein
VLWEADEVSVDLTGDVSLKAAHGIVNLLNVELAEYARGCGLGRAGLSWGGQAAAGVTPVISFQVVNRSVIARR